MSTALDVQAIIHMSPAEVAESLDLAADFIEARGWTTGQGWNYGPDDDNGTSGSSKLCLEGGIMAALNITVGDFDERGRAGLAWVNDCNAYTAVREYLLAHGKVALLPARPLPLERQRGSHRRRGLHPPPHGRRRAARARRGRGMSAKTEKEWVRFSRPTNGKASVTVTVQDENVTVRESAFTYGNLKKAVTETRAQARASLAELAEAMK